MRGGHCSPEIAVGWVGLIHFHSCFCRGGFSYDSATLFGSASSAKQQDLQQLETPKPAHSGNLCYLPIKPLGGSIGKQLFFCRGGFSRVNAPLFGSASSVKQQDSQQLEVPKPAHSGNLCYLPIKPTKLSVQ